MHKKLLRKFIYLAFVASVSHVSAMENDNMSINTRVKKCENALVRHDEINSISRFGGGSSEDTLYKAIDNMSTLDYIDYVAVVQGKSDPSHTEIENYRNDTYRINNEYNKAKHRWPK